MEPKLLCTYIPVLNTGTKFKSLKAVKICFSIPVKGADVLATAE
jgi:hypothetical protein